MDNQNRLLAMLNSAAASHPAQASQPNQTAPSTASTGLNPPSGTIREPSPYPPPPSLQSVSLNDLFRNLGSAPPTSQPNYQSRSGFNGNPSAMMQGGESHAHNLLGMLGRGGGPQNGGSPSGPLSPPGGSGTPLGSNQAINLLSMFKSPPPPAPVDPVISQTSAPPPAPPVDRAVDPSPPPHAAGSKSPQVTQMPESNQSLGPPPSAPKANKSPFDFVSPFDVFDKPSPKPSPKPTAPAKVSTAAKPATSPKPQKAASPLVPQKEDAFAVPPARINVTVIHPGDVEVSPKSPEFQEGTPEQQTRTSVEATPSTQKSSSAASDGHIESPHPSFPWQSSKASRGIQSEGPKSLSSHVKIDFSKLSGRAQINTDGLLSIVPITKIKDAKVVYGPGRIVAMAGRWVAYSMSRGRVRLIDIDTGNKLLLQLPESVTDTTIIDIAATSTVIAVLAGDSSTTVFQVPTTWQTDGAASKVLAHVPIGERTRRDRNEGVSGPVHQIELLEQNGRVTLLIGGLDGLAIMDLSSTTSLSEVSARNIIRAEQGELRAFCINQNKQAVVVLTESHIGVWRINERVSVWKGPVATDYPTLPATSVQFTDTHIIIGRANDTVFEVVQLGPNHAILSTIELIAPSPSPAVSHYSHAIFDNANQILWVAAHARGSLLGFKYTLKGAGPTREALTYRGSVAAFDQLIEIPLDPVVSFTMRANEEGLVVFYATSEGYMKATIDQEALSAFTSVASATAKQAPSGLQSPAVIAQQPTPGSSKAVNGDKKEHKATPKTKQAAKAPVSQAPTPSAPQPAPEVDEKPDIREAPSPQQSEASKATTTTTTSPEVVKASTPASPDLSVLLKQTEDRLANKIRQNIESTLSTAPKGGAVDGAKLAAEVSAKIGEQITAAVSEALQQEMKKSMVPAATASIQDEIRSVAPQAIQSALTQSLTTVNKDIERALLSSMPRIVSSTVSPALEKILQEAIRQIVLPSLAKSSQQMADQITKEFKSEMVQVRKDLQPPAPPVDNGRVLQTLVDAVAALQKQVEQLSKAQPPAPTTMPVQAPRPTTGPPFLGLDLEEIFVHVLGQEGSSPIIGLVNDFWGMGAHILPLTFDRKPPFSQIVVITLLHRIAMTSTELAPNDPVLFRLIQWARRAAMHLDTNDPLTREHVGDIILSVNGILENTIHNLMSRFGDNIAAQHAGRARDIIGILNAKHPQNVAR